MVALRIAIFIYCCSAVIACGWFLSDVVRSLQGLQPQVVSQAGELQAFMAEEQNLLQAWQDLDSKQRRERKGYDGPEAVDASYETQLALDALGQAKILTNAVKTQYEGLQSRYHRSAGWITPLIVLGLIHLIGAIALWPKKSQMPNRK